MEYGRDRNKLKGFSSGDLIEGILCKGFQSILDNDNDNNDNNK